MASNDNYPMGVNGSSDYFNKPDLYCPTCELDVEPAWEFCPWCGAHLEWEEYEEEGVKKWRL